MSAYTDLIAAGKPQAYYRLNETSGTVAHDSSGNHYDGALTGVASYGSPGVGGNESAITFTSNGVLALPYTLNYTTFGTFTFEMWSAFTGPAWHHFAAAWDGATTLLYTDGALSSGTLAPLLGGVLLDWFGASQSGTLAHVALYSRLLSAAEVLLRIQTIFARTTWTIRDNQATWKTRA